MDIWKIWIKIYSRELSVLKKLKLDVEIYRNRGSEMEGADKEGASIDAGTGGEERDGGGRKGEIIFQCPKKT